MNRIIQCTAAFATSEGQRDGIKSAGQRTRRASLAAGLAVVAACASASVADIQFLSGSAYCHTVGYYRYVSNGVVLPWWSSYDPSRTFTPTTSSFDVNTGDFYGWYTNNAVGMHGSARINGTLNRSAPGNLSSINVNAYGTAENTLDDPTYLQGKNDDNSAMTIAFMVTQTQNFSFSGHVRATCNQIYFQSVGFVELKNLDTDQQILSVERVESGNVDYSPAIIGPAAYDTNRNIVWNFTGTLAPGRYQLRTSAASNTNIGWLCPTDRMNGSSYAESQMTLSFTAVCPGITTHPASATACAAGGSSPSFSVTPSGTGPFTYQWQSELGIMPGTWVNLTDHEGVNTVAGANAANLVLTNLTPSAAGRYRVIVTNACGSATSNPATLTIADCCPADFNHSGIVSTQDLFDFLAAFFAGCA